MADLQLFHITPIDYPLGMVTSIADTSHFHQATLLDERRWINEFLDTNRPVSTPSRKKSFHAFDSISNCFGYWGNKPCTTGGPNLYKVKMTNPRKVPMALVNKLHRKGEGHGTNIQIACEYWTPTNNWKFNEFLSEEMEILEQIDISIISRFNNAIILLGQDYDLANNLFS